MFKLTPNPTFIAAVALSLPGEAKPANVKITFKHLVRPQIKAFFEGLEGKTDAEALGEIVVGWEGFDADFSQDALTELCSNYPKAGGEIFTAFKRELVDAPTKN